MTPLELATQCGATEVPVYTPTHRAVIGWLFGRDALTAFVERIREEERERCAKKLDDDADRQERAWKKHLASGKGGPATSFHSIARGYAAAIREARDA
jgi:hypothetical protein